jgi:hypothetical protein
MPLIDVWAVLQDPEIPREVGQRLLARQRAVSSGVDPEPVPAEDVPFLSRHVVEDWRNLKPMTKPEQVTE